MFALVDCNSFYASCEQVFRPDLRGKPIVVLSNNDGCIVARSQEAKQVGIPDLQPFFKIEFLLKKYNVTVFSSNYPLYGDMSQRVLATLRLFSERIEVYSIDEVFLDVEKQRLHYQAYGQSIRDTVWRHTKIPVSIGIAPTKTLAKLANRAAKKIPKLNGVCVLDEPHKWQWLLKRSALTDIWGVAKKSANRLNDLGIYTAWDLACADEKRVRRRSNVQVERTIRELNGKPCLDLETMIPQKQRIYCSRSFGEKAKTMNAILEALSLYTARACEKLRAQSHLAVRVHVFMNTSPHDEHYYMGSDVVQLLYPTDDTRVITQAVCRLAKKLFRPGYAYLKVGVGLVDLIDKANYQHDLFHKGQTEKSDKLMAVMDRINKTQGNSTVFLAAQGVAQPWRMRQQYRSPGYTTQWADIPIVHAKT